MTVEPTSVEVQPVPGPIAIPKGSCPTPNDQSDKNRTDVLFLLDSSNSYNQQKFMHAIQLLMDTVKHFRNIGPNGTQGDRPDAENVLVVLTDGQSDDKIQEPVEIAKKNNVTVLVIATVEANPNYIMELAGNMDNVFRFHTD
ncbi:unnamed protein product, partial [Cylicostephanus goldi]